LAQADSNIKQLSHAIEDWDFIISIAGYNPGKTTVFLRDWWRFAGAKATKTRADPGAEDCTNSEKK
jgi:hypothetical protein